MMLTLVKAGSLMALTLGLSLKKNGSRLSPAAFGLKLGTTNTRAEVCSTRL